MHTISQLHLHCNNKMYLGSTTCTMQSQMSGVYRGVKQSILYFNVNSHHAQIRRTRFYIAFLFIHLCLLGAGIIL